MATSVYKNIRKNFSLLSCERLGAFQTAHAPNWLLDEIGWYLVGAPSRLSLSLSLARSLSLSTFSVQVLANKRFPKRLSAVPLFCWTSLHLRGRTKLLFIRTTICQNSSAALSLGPSPPLDPFKLRTASGKADRLAICEVDKYLRPLAGLQRYPN